MTQSTWRRVGLAAAAPLGGVASVVGRMALDMDLPGVSGAGGCMGRHGGPGAEGVARLQPPMWLAWASGKRQWPSGRPVIATYVDVHACSQLRPTQLVEAGLLGRREGRRKEGPLVLGRWWHRGEGGASGWRGSVIGSTDRGRACGDCGGSREGKVGGASGIA